MSTQTVKEAREEVLAGMQKSKGIICPCCDQKVNLYPRKLNSGMASMLIAMHRATLAGHGPWIHVSKYFLEKKMNAVAQEYSKLRFWNLIEEQTDDDGKRIPGMWRITDKGVQFVSGDVEVPRTAFVYNNTVMGFSKDKTDIHRALTDQFDYDELMAA